MKKSLIIFQNLARLCAIFENLFLDFFMALKATIYKVDLNIANMDVHQYGDYQLTMALHPSETIERLMVRVLAYARFAEERFGFTKDLFETDEPALWEKDLTGQLVQWIEVGLPELKIKSKKRAVVKMSLWWRMVQRLQNGISAVQN